MPKIKLELTTKDLEIIERALSCSDITKHEMYSRLNLEEWLKEELKEEVEYIREAISCYLYNNDEVK